MTNFKKYLVPIAGAAILVAAYRGYGWQGVAVAATGLVTWLLLHVARTIHVLKQAADRPIGYVASAVMLNAKLRAGLPLAHVMAMTRAIGERRSPAGAEPETYRWTDTGGSWVEARFAVGKLLDWTMVRPPGEDGPLPPPAA